MSRSNLLHPCTPSAGPWPADTQTRRCKAVRKGRFGAIAMLHLWILGGAFLFNATLAAEEDTKPDSDPPLRTTYKDRPVVTIPLLAKPPKLEAQLKDPFWLAAKALKEFQPLSGLPDPPKQQTQAFVGTTSAALYVGVRCMESDLDGLKGKEAPRDSAIWRDDEVEVFLLPGEDSEKPYYQISANAAGTLSDAFNRNKKWNGEGVQVKVGREENAWTVVFEIPFPALQLSKNKADRAKGWRFNLIRNRPPHKGDPLDRYEIPRPVSEETGWAPTEALSSQEPDMFGYAFFEVIGGKGPGQK